MIDDSMPCRARDVTTDVRGAETSHPFMFMFVLVLLPSVTSMPIHATTVDGSGGRLS